MALETFEMRKMLMGVVLMAGVGCANPPITVDGDIGGYSLDAKSGSAQLNYDRDSTFAQILIADVDDICGITKRSIWRPSQTAIYMQMARAPGNDIIHTYPVTSDMESAFASANGGVISLTLRFAGNCVPTDKPVQESWTASAGYVTISKVTETTVTGDFDLLFRNETNAASHHLTGHFEVPRCDFNTSSTEGEDRCEVAP